MADSALKVTSFIEPDGEAYDLACRSIDIGDAPVGAMVCTVEPGKQSRIHNHFETESFLIIEGSGVVRSGDEQIEVSTGQVVRVPPFADHIVENTGAKTPLRFLSVFWEGDAARPAQTEAPAPRPALIFSTPPTPNGDLHLGHLAGPYLGADVYRRFVEACGVKAMHATGRDDHQTYVVTRAHQADATPQATADEFAARIRETLRACDIDLGYFIEPDRSGDYAAFVRDVVATLYQAGYIVEKTEDALFDATSGRYLHEAYVTGECPHCGHSSDGNACEQCGRPNQCVDLKRPVSKFDGLAPVRKPLKRLYFRLGAVADRLGDYVKSTPMSARALALSQAMLDDGLPDIAVAHPGEHGIAAPVAGFEGHRIYVWFEMAAGYLWAAAHADAPGALDLREASRRFYGQNEAQVVHFFGFDNSYYHTILFPAVYLALDWGLVPPQAHVVNELLDLEGKKFSTSRRHLIWGRDLLACAPADYVRWYLCEVRPEGLRTDFSCPDFAARVNALFAGTLKTWLADLDNLLTGRFDGALPATGAWTPEHRAFYERMLALRRACLDHCAVDAFSPQQVTRALGAMVSEAARFLMAQSRLAESGGAWDYLRTVAALSAWALKLFAILSRPITPGLAASLLAVLDIDRDVTMADTDFPPAGARPDFTRVPPLPPVDARRVEEVTDA